jgi:hypothetical protein
MVNDAITDLQPLDGIANMGRRCPTVIKTPLGSLVDVLRYILSYLGIANKVCSVLEHGSMPESFTRLY